MGIEAVKVTLEQLLSTTSRYKISPYQRKYEWSEYQIGRLIDDLLADWRASGKPAPHFLGSIIIHDRKTSKQQTQLIDGQQRLTSISIMLAVLRDKAVKDGQLRQTLASYLVQPPTDAASLPFTRIEHHRGDEVHFEQYVIRKDATNPKPETKDEQAERMRLNVGVAREKLRTIATDEQIAEFRRHLMERCEAIKITIGGKDDAFRIFRTVNGTGQPVRDQDILRVTLVERATNVPGTRKRYSDRWDEAETRLGAIGFERYLRLKRFALAGELDLDAPLRVGFEGDSIPGVAALPAFLEALESDTESYEAIVSGEPPMVSFGRSYQLPSILYSLSLVEFDEWQALALELYRRIKAGKRSTGDRNDLSVWMRKLERLAWHCQFMAGERFADSDRLKRFANILKYFRNHAPEAWTIAASDIELSDKEKRVMLETLRGAIDPKWPPLRRVLIRLEQALGHGRPAHRIRRKYTIEHILPKSGGGKVWTGKFAISDAEARQLALQLGNLCFVSNNKALGELPFAQKKELIKDTDAVDESLLTADACNEDDWTVAIIKARTNRLVSTFAKALDLS